MITAIALCWLGPLLMMMIGGKHLQEGFPVQPAVARQSRLADDQLSHSISPGEEEEEVEEEEEEEDDDGGDDGDNDGDDGQCPVCQRRILYNVYNPS